jgi:hypothetical protein
MKACKPLISRVLLAAAALFSGACGSGDFNYGKVRNIIEGSPQRLDAEYVVLTPQQVDCGVQNDLWDPPSSAGTRQSARLAQKGRDLKFSDDVSIGDMPKPYIQIRGDFSLVVTEIINDRDGPEKETKLVESRLGPVIQHSCFPNPLPLMGVRKGNFTQDVSPVLFFRYNNGWMVDHVVH